MAMKDGQYRRGARAFLLLGFLGLFFTSEGTLPLHPALSRANIQVAPLGKYLDLQAATPPIVETSDEYDAYGEWHCLPGPFLKEFEPGDDTPFCEPEGFYRADCGAVSLPISRSPPGFHRRSIVFQPI
jgi:hypothetical protein